MASVNIALIGIVPSLFGALQWIQEKVRSVQTERSRDWQINEEKMVSDKEVDEHRKNK